MNDTTGISLLAQLGIAGIFGLAVVQVFGQLMQVQTAFRTHLIEQNRILLAALLRTDPEAAKRYAAAGRSATNLGDAETGGGD